MGSNQGSSTVDSIELSSNQGSSTGDSIELGSSTGYSIELGSNQGSSTGDSIELQNGVIAFLVYYSLYQIIPDHHISPNVLDRRRQALFLHLFICSVPQFLFPFIGFFFVTLEDQHSGEASSLWKMW